MQPGGMLPGLEPQGPDTKRLLATVLLVTAMWVGFTYLSPSQPAAPVAADAGPVAAQTTTAPTAATSAQAEVAPATNDNTPEERREFKADVAQASHAEAVSVRGGYRAGLTSKGAQLDRFELTGYNDAKTGQPIDLANAEYGGARVMALKSRGGDVQLAPDASYAVVSSDANKIVFERKTPSGVVVTRTYAFDPARFAFTHDITLKNESDAKKTAMLDLVLTGQERAGERDEGGMFSATPDALAGACKVKGSRETFTSAKVEKEAKSFVGNVDYAAIDRHYFLAAVVTSGESCAAAPFNRGDVHGFQISVAQPAVDLAPGETKTIHHDGYFGPKQVGLLADFGHDLGENINFGWFGAISRPILWVLVKLNGYVGNFGLAIIILTLLLNAITFPLTQKSYVSMQKVKKFKPQIDELQKKYGHDRTLLGQKQMELYQKEGVNPLAGCFPMLITMPIWFALYRTLSQAVELYQQPFYLGIHDLTQPDMLMFGFPFLPLIVGALMLFQTWLQPPPSDQPQMKYMMWFMPFMFTFMMLKMASGLSIYMIANSLMRMGQQFYIKRKYK
jgi:YidC/Oxa1 family membrane protein insertase